MSSTGGFLSRAARRLAGAPYACPRDSTQQVLHVANDRELFEFCIMILNVCYRGRLCKDARVWKACGDLHYEVEKESGKSMLRVKCSYNIKGCCNRELECTFWHDTALTSLEMSKFQILQDWIIAAKRYSMHKFAELAKKLKVLEVALYPFTEVESASTKITTTGAIGRTNVPSTMPNVPLSMTEAERTQFLETLLLTVRQSQLPE